MKNENNYQTSVRGAWNEICEKFHCTTAYLKKLSWTCCKSCAEIGFNEAVMKYGFSLSTEAFQHSADAIIEKLASRKSVTKEQLMKLHSLADGKSAMVAGEQANILGVMFNFAKFKGEAYTYIDCIYDQQIADSEGIALDRFTNRVSIDFIKFYDI